MKAPRWLGPSLVAVGLAYAVREEHRQIAARRRPRPPKPAPGWRNARFDPDQERHLRAIILIAENDGDAYENGKNAYRAVQTAIRTYTAQQIAEMSSDLRIIRTAAIREVKRGWRSGQGAARRGRQR